MSEKVTVPLDITLELNKDLIDILRIKNGVTPELTENQVILELIDSIKFFLEYKMIPFASPREVKATLWVNAPKQNTGHTCRCGGANGQGHCLCGST